MGLGEVKRCLNGVGKIKEDILATRYAVRGAFVENEAIGFACGTVQLRLDVM